MKRRISACAWAIALGLVFIAAPGVRAGQPGLRIVDGDTLVLAGETIRLEGIDAPELSQTCLDPSGREYPCGKSAGAYLRTLIGTGNVICEGRETDLYGRRIATCYAAGIDLNEAMVKAGQALAFRRYSTRYVAAEDQAHRNGLGLWAGNAEAPWTYRSRRWQVASQDAPKNCPIKGNISANGRIYHTPWSASYARTRINEAAGERWFCSEEEARAAGWRAPS